MLPNSINNSTFGRIERAINADNMVPWWLTLKFRILSLIDSERKKKGEEGQLHIGIWNPSQLCGADGPYVTANIGQ